MRQRVALLFRAALAGGTNPFPPAEILLGSEQGLALDLSRGRLAIRSGESLVTGPIADAGTVVGAPGTKLSSDRYIRIPIASWPYSPTEITIAGQIRFDADTDATARVIVSIDPGGRDRLIFDVGGGDTLPNLNVGSGSRAGADSWNIYQATPIVAGRWYKFVASAGPGGGHFTLDGRTERIVTHTPIFWRGPASPQAYHGIGCAAAEAAGDAAGSPLRGDLRMLLVRPRATPADVAARGLPLSDSPVSPYAELTAAARLGGDDGFCLDGRTGDLAVVDSATPANDYTGAASGRATVTGTWTPGSSGVRCDASNFARLALAYWPYSTTAVTIACRVRFDEATHTLQRVILQIDSGGNDRLYLGIRPNESLLVLSIGTGSTAVNVFSLSNIVAGQWYDLIAVAGPSGAFIVLDGVLERTNAAALAANPTPLAHMGIGASTAATGGAANAEPMRGDILHLTVLPRAASQAEALLGLPLSGAPTPAHLALTAEQWLGGEDGAAFAPTTDTAAIRSSGSTTTGDIGLLGLTGTLTTGSGGATIDSTHYARLAAADWPYSPTAITICAKFKLAEATHGSARTVFEIEPAGNYRLAVYIAADDTVLTLAVGQRYYATTMRGVTALAAGQWYDLIVSAGPDEVYMVLADVPQVHGRKLFMAANPAPLAHMGIGAPSAATGGAANTQPMQGDLRNLVILPRAVGRARARRGLPLDRPLKIIAALGDSHTQNNANGAGGLPTAYPAVVAQRLGVGTWVDVNRGISGNTTAEMAARIDEIFESGLPHVVVVYGGTNDSSGQGLIQASPAPAADRFCLLTDPFIRHDRDGWVRVAGELAQTDSVDTDIGQVILTAPLAGGAPAAGATVTIDTQATLEWIIGQLQGRGCTRIILMVQHYLNFATGGDTLVSEPSHLTTLRASQRAAAAAMTVELLDLYETFRARIVAGLDAQGSASWHVGQGNTHLNDYGQSIIGQALSDRINQLGWQ